MSEEEQNNKIIKQRLLQLEKKLETQNILLAMIINPKKIDDEKSTKDIIWEYHNLGFSNEVISILLNVTIKTVTNRIGEIKKEI